MIWYSSLYYPFHIAWWCEWFQASPNPKINSLPCADGTGIGMPGFLFSPNQLSEGLCFFSRSYDYTCFAVLDQCWIRVLTEEVRYRLWNFPPSCMWRPPHAEVAIADLFSTGEARLLWSPRTWYSEPTPKLLRRGIWDGMGQSPNSTSCIS